MKPQDQTFREGVHTETDRQRELRHRILVVDDDEQLLDILSILLETEGYEPERCTNGDQLTRAVLESRQIGARHFSAVLLDLRLGNENGLDLLPKIREQEPDVPIFMMTAHGDVDSAVSAFGLGANGYIKKPFEEGMLLRQINQAVDSYSLKKDLGRLIEASSSPQAGIRDQASSVETLIPCRDPSMTSLLQRVETAARVSSNVVIKGESGTGKELIARALHLCGPRKDKPFVAFNCAALPETLIESELFGHVKGAYTDAKENRSGLFVRAHGGTLFLDEIGDAPPSIQAKLLRVIQEREVLPLGSKSPIKIDVRIVSATHRSLIEEMNEGRFRRDLYYRLQVIPIEVPALRDRKRDILFLAEFFAKKISTQLSLPFVGFQPGVQRALEEYSWPGNVRELQNRVEHALALGRGGWISTAGLFPEKSSESGISGDQMEQVGPTLSESAPAGVSSAASDVLTQVDNDIVPYRTAKEDFEKSYWMRLLKEARGNIALAARIAEKSRAEIYSLLKKHGLHPKLTHPDGSHGGNKEAE